MVNKICSSNENRFQVLIFLFKRCTCIMMPLTFTLSSDMIVLLLSYNFLHFMLFARFFFSFGFGKNWIFWGFNRWVPCLYQPLLKPPACEHTMFDYLFCATVDSTRIRFCNFFMLQNFSLFQNVNIMWAPWSWSLFYFFQFHCHWHWMNFGCRHLFWCELT
jgi:hypothetical protein